MTDFERAYRAHLAAVFRFAMRCVGRRDVAEDITSEAFLALYEHMDQVDVDQLPAWLLTVVKHRAANYWRHLAVEQRFAGSALEKVPVSEPPADTWLFESKRLKPIHRVCLILRYVHDLDRHEIAEFTGLSETQVKGHLQYARRLLREELMGVRP